MNISMITIYQQLYSFILRRAWGTSLIKDFSFIQYSSNIIYFLSRLYLYLDLADVTVR